ncbi:MAG: SAM-dependent methyltransferase [Phycisphaerae bacterium]|nr:SAM-dependent methyltransferase [Phycisphaerae bacterium]
MKNNKTTYRTSHSDVGYGELYQNTYNTGYYATLWNKIERPLIKNIFNELKKGGAANCLDFACGTGRITSVLEEVFDCVTGVDVSDEMLLIAKKQLNSATLINQDITAETIDGGFDVISSFRFFLNAENGLKDSSLKALYDLLNENGTLVINIHANKRSPLGVMYRLRNWLYRKNIANTLGLSEFKEHLVKAGFEIKDVHWYGFYPRTGWLLGGLASLCLKPFETFCKTTRIFPKSCAQNFIVLCEKA